MKHPEPIALRSPRIGVVGTVGVPARYGGFETLAEQLARHVGPHQAQLVIYGQRSAYPELAGLRDLHFEGHERVLLPMRANGPQSMLHDAWAMLHAALVARVDVMLVLGYSGAWALPLMRRLRPGMRIVTNIDGMEWRRDKFGARAKQVLRWLEGTAIRHSDTIIADNAALIPLVRDAHPVLVPRLIAYGGDHTLVTPAAMPIAVEGAYYLSVARIEPENNCAMILAAFAAAPGERLVFVGNWQASAYGRELKARHTDDPRLRLLDPVYDLGVLAALRAGACGYVHGHSVGGTNPSLVEALFHTRRILAFDCSFNRATLDGRGAYFQDAAALTALLGQANGLEIALEIMDDLRRQYSWRTIADVYLEACNRR